MTTEEPAIKPGADPSPSGDAFKDERTRAFAEQAVEVDELRRRLGLNLVSTSNLEGRPAELIKGDILPVERDKLWQELQALMVKDRANKRMTNYEYCLYTLLHLLFVHGRADTEQCLTVIGVERRATRQLRLAFDRAVARIQRSTFARPEEIEAETTRTVDPDKE